MKVLTLIICLAMSNLTSASDILTIRKMFYAATESSSKTNEFLKHLQSTNQSKPLIIGYTGMAYMLLAKNAFNPISKLNNFFKGRDMLESAIRQEPNNIELRFLRLSVQQNAPVFLNYSADIGQDKKFIVANYTKLSDNDLKQRISNFLNGK